MRTDRTTFALLVALAIQCAAVAGLSFMTPARADDLWVIKAEVILPTGETERTVTWGRGVWSSNDKCTAFLRLSPALAADIDGLLLSEIEKHGDKVGVIVTCTPNED